jgi:hypothetical protein
MFSQTYNAYIPTLAVAGGRQVLPTEVAPNDDDDDEVEAEE